MKRTSFTLLLTILLSMVGLNAFAGFDYNEKIQIGSLYFYLDEENNEAKVAKSDYSGDIDIPSYIDYNSKRYSVTSIDNYAFSWCFGLTSVIIPNSMTSISSCAFEYCFYLTSVTIPNSVTSIDNNAFDHCVGLTSITIPNSVTSIGSKAFQYCRSLTSLTIPKSVTHIGSSAFACHSDMLESIVVESDNPKYDSRNNCNAIIRTSNNTLLAGCNKTIIPNDVTSIGDYAFYGCSGLTSVAIPNSVTMIGSSAFQDCSGLTSITIPNSVTSIGSAAFYGCSNLTSVTIPNSVTSIGSTAFYGCSGLTSVTIPNSVTIINLSSFYGCSGLTSITIPNSVTIIDEYAFRECFSLTFVIVPNNVTSIGGWAFGYCNALNDFYCYAEQVPETGYRAFKEANQSNATLHVPAASIEAYKNAEQWKDFKNIVPLTDSDPKPTGIANINQSITSNQHYYSLDGKHTATPQQGLNIVKMSDGTTRKVIIK